MDLGDSAVAPTFQPRLGGAVHDHNASAADQAVRGPASDDPQCDAEPDKDGAGREFADRHAHLQATTTLWALSAGESALGARSHNVASGGRVSVADAGSPCHGWAVARTDPRLPTPLPA